MVGLTAMFEKEWMRVIIRDVDLFKAVDPTIRSELSSVI